MDAIHHWNTWIGTDEAGKGDYFGPLVAAAVYVDAECRETFSDLGITDGKRLSNPRVHKLAESMHNRYPHHIAVVEKMPAAYNSLYATLRRQGQNLNHLLASLHAEAIRTLANSVGAKHALVDQFAKNDLITPYLIPRANNARALWGADTSTALEIEIKQVPKAERDIAVAAASIIARDAFLKGMDTLSETYQMRLPRGAYQVVEAGREFVKQHGIDALQHVAKLHFHLTDAVLDS